MYVRVPSRYTTLVSVWLPCNTAFLPALAPALHPALHPALRPTSRASSLLVLLPRRSGESCGLEEWGILGGYQDPHGIIQPGGI